MASGVGSQLGGPATFSTLHLDSITALWLDGQGPGTAKEVGSTATGCTGALVGQPC